MSGKIADWRERASGLTEASERLKLVQEVVESLHAPRHLQIAARQAASAIGDFIKHGTEADRHRSEHRWITFKEQIPVANS